MARGIAVLTLLFLVSPGLVRAADPAGAETPAPQPAAAISVSEVEERADLLEARIREIDASLQKAELARSIEKELATMEAERAELGARIDAKLARRVIP